MFLLHQTDKQLINKIITDGYLRPASVTKQRNQNPYNVNLPYIFFSCCKKKDFNKLFPYTFVFESNILDAHTFYTNTSHVAGKTASTVTISKNDSSRNKHLDKLLKNSRVNKYFMIFQEIFIKYKVPINKAKYLILPKNIEKKSLESITKILPSHIKVILK